MKNKDLKLNKNIDSELLKVNKNEYFVQKTSNLKAALEMGLTKEEFELICNKIKKIPRIKI